MVSWRSLELESCQKKCQFYLEIFRGLWNRVPCSRDVPNEWVFSSKNTASAKPVPSQCISFVSGAMIVIPEISGDLWKPTRFC